MRNPSGGNSYCVKLPPGSYGVRVPQHGDGVAAAPWGLLSSAQTKAARVPQPQVLAEGSLFIRGSVVYSVKFKPNL